MVRNVCLEPVSGLGISRRTYTVSPVTNAFVNFRQIENTESCTITTAYDTNPVEFVNRPSSRLGNAFHPVSDTQEAPHPAESRSRLLARCIVRNGNAPRPNRLRRSRSAAKPSTAHTGSSIPRRCTTRKCIWLRLRLRHLRNTKITLLHLSRVECHEFSKSRHFTNPDPLELV